MTVDLHSAVRTAVDARRARAEKYLGDLHTAVPISWLEEGFVKIRTEYEREALAMCDWADDVLARHRQWRDGSRICTGHTGAPIEHSEYPCAELISVAAAFGVETGETP